MSAFAPEVVAEFPEQFAACEALRDWARAHRPQRPRTDGDDRAEMIVFLTYVRSSKTFQASLRLSMLGYGVQAAMLNRSLFEDMLVAHWIRKHPDGVPERLDRYEQHSIGMVRSALDKYDRGGDFAQGIAPLTKRERNALRREFGRRHWTGLTMKEIAEAVEDEWEHEELDRRPFWQVFDVTHYFNNQLLHHTTWGLRAAWEYVEKGDETLTRYDTGPSTTHIHQALLGAFYSYAHTVSLFVTDPAEREELGKLYWEHGQLFMRVRDRPHGKALESNGGEQRQTGGAGEEPDVAQRADSDNGGD